MIGIIDYGMGNLRSVQKAFEHVGAEATIMRGPEQMNGSQHLVLPGVGAFADGMEHLRERGWIEPIRKYIKTGRPFLGICLGMQLLFDGSEEDAPSPEKLVPGLRVLPGKVVRFQPGKDDDTGRRLKVPHMGWNTLNWTVEDPLLQNLDQGSAVYFVHGYYVVPEESPRDPLTCAIAHHGDWFCASVWQGNIWATQFHPEKSQAVGLKMLSNFADL